MDSTASSPAIRLGMASKALRAQLDYLTQRSGQSGNMVPDFSSLLTAIGHYEKAVLACLPPDPADVFNLTPEQLLAYRETDPVYRLGWVRGHKDGLAQGQRTNEPILSLYARYSALPPPVDPTVLMQQVRRFLATLQQRYSAGPIPHR